MKGVCSSCGKKVLGDPEKTEFPCPKCGKQILTRCGHCRAVVAKFKCPECGFEGPN